MIMVTGARQAGKSTMLIHLAQNTGRVFSLLEKSGKDIDAGGIICMAAKPFPIDTGNSMILVNLL
jgi:predicted AAA+ superfamily ATPase